MIKAALGLTGTRERPTVVLASQLRGEIGDPAPETRGARELDGSAAAFIPQRIVNWQQLGLSPALWLTAARF